MSQALKIECTLKRAGGTQVTIGANSYHFRPETVAPDAPHVAVVEDMGDVQKFMAIPEAYRLIGTADVAPAPAPAPAPVVAPVVAPTPAPEAKLDAAEVPEDLQGKSLEDLQAIYTTETGLKPHNRTGVATLTKQIIEARAAAAGAAVVQPLGATPAA